MLILLKGDFMPISTILSLPKTVFNSKATPILSGTGVITGVALGALGPVLFFFAGVNVLPMALLAGGGGGLALLSLTTAGTWTVAKIIQHARKPAGPFSKLTADELDEIRYDNGDTLLIHIVRSGRADELEELLKLGANPMLKDDKGNTPLHYACIMGDLQKVQLLITHAGLIAINAKNNFNETPLHAAAWALNNTQDAETIKAIIAIIHLLRRLDADLTVQNRDGQTPRQLVQDHHKQLFE